MLLPNRNEATDSYRYGFQGQEMDDEIKGKGNSLNYTFRMHDPRLGRFFSMDPLTHKFPWYSPYQFAGNSPIAFIDLEGLERYYAGDGSLIGQWGLNPLPLMVVSDKNISDDMKENAENYDDKSLRDANATKAKLFDPSETIHYGAIKAVKGGALLYQELAKGTNDPVAKAAYIEANDLLMDFAVGNAPYLRVYESYDPMTSLINKENRVVNEVVSDFERVLSANGTTAEKYFEEQNSFSGGFEFSPDHAISENGIIDGLIESGQEHLKAITENPLAIVIGGMSYKMTALVNGKGNITGFNVTLSNISGKGSLLLHQATDLKHLEGQKIPLSNKKQIFKLYISINDYNSEKKKQNEIED